MHKTKYLPRLDGQSDDEYEAYKSRACDRCEGGFRRNQR